MSGSLDVPSHGCTVVRWCAGKKADVLGFIFCLHCLLMPISQLSLPMLVPQFWAFKCPLYLYIMQYYSPSVPQNHMLLLKQLRYSIVYTFGFVSPNNGAIYVATKVVRISFFSQTTIYLIVYLGLWVQILLQKINSNLIHFYLILCMK